jgi:hypothetical protein
MADLALSGLGPVFDLGQQGRLDPDAAMSDALAVRLGISDQRLEARVNLWRCRYRSHRQMEQSEQK